MDGFGIGKQNDYNAIHLADLQTKGGLFVNHLFKECGHSLLKTDGEAVGLPEGQMGNSEVGHMTIGSGRVLYQDLVRINQAIENNEIESSEAFKNFVSSLGENVCHVLGMLSDGGVHSHEKHIVYFVELLLKLGVRVKCHIFLDGRDTAPFCGSKALKKFLDKFYCYENFELSTVCGRYYGMDRDNRFDRTQVAFNAIFDANGIQTENFIQSIKEQKIGDEFLLPMVNKDYRGFRKDDGIITLNWRADRMRQIVNAVSNPDFTIFERSNYCSKIMTIAEYSEEISKFAPAIFLKQSTKNTLGRVIANHGLRQLRIAETEKYAHVTFFFDCCEKELIPNYREILIKSPAVPTYDLTPEMSAEEITNTLLSEIQNFDFFVINFANLDMVGHTGNISATVKAVKTVDECVEKIIDEFDKFDGIVVITADHGNAEEMFDEKTCMLKTSHSLNLVPFCIVTKDRKKFHLKNGSLSDIAPTLLHLLYVKKTEEITGVSLVEP